MWVNARIIPSATNERTEINHVTDHVRKPRKILASKTTEILARFTPINLQVARSDCITTGRSVPATLAAPKLGTLSLMRTLTEQGNEQGNFTGYQQFNQYFWIKREHTRFKAPAAPRNYLAPNLALTSNGLTHCLITPDLVILITPVERNDICASKSPSTGLTYPRPYQYPSVTTPHTIEQTYDNRLNDSHLHPTRRRMEPLELGSFARFRIGGTSCICRAAEG